LIWPRHNRRNVQTAQFIVMVVSADGWIGQPAGDVSRKPGGRLPLLSARAAVTHTTLKRAATSFAAW